MIEAYVAGAYVTFALLCMSTAYATCPAGLQRRLLAWHAPGFYTALNAGYALMWPAFWAAFIWYAVRDG